MQYQRCGAEFSNTHVNTYSSDRGTVPSSNARSGNVICKCPGDVTKHLSEIHVTDPIITDKARQKRNQIAEIVDITESTEFTSLKIIRCTRLNGKQGLEVQSVAH